MSEPRTTAGKDLLEWPSATRNMASSVLAIEDEARDLAIAEQASLGVSVITDYDTIKRGLEGLHRAIARQERERLRPLVSAAVYDALLSDPEPRP